MSLSRLDRDFSPHLLVWRGEGAFRTEAAEVQLRDGRLQATGTQIGVEPVAYRLDYELTTGADYVTSCLRVAAAGECWSRGLELLREGDAWTVSAESSGDVDLPPPGGDADTFAEALDCDLGLCPLTNTMPILREGLHESDGGERDFVMAWVSVPDLRVVRSEQTYRHLRRDGDGAVVRYGGSHRGGSWEIEVDSAGLVVRYEDLAERVFPPA